MTDPRCVLLALSAATLAAACSGPNLDTTEGAIAACDWPAAANTFDADAGEGCAPRPKFEICEVPNGGTVLADGGIITADGGIVTGTCTDRCSLTEYALTCESALPAGNPIPAPDPLLNCTVIPIPTPSNALFYCCPCVH